MPTRIDVSAGFYKPRYPLLQDTGKDTAQIMQLVAGCGTDDAACAAGFATICAMPATPPNCTINNCGTITVSVSCGTPVIQDIDGIWSVK